jgi:hypothetical protein
MSRRQPWNVEVLSITSDHIVGHSTLGLWLVFGLGLMGCVFIAVGISWQEIELF